MSIASLTRFTVPIDTSVGATTQGLLMPKLKYRFRVIFQNFGVSLATAELTKQVKDATRPNAQLTRQVIDVYNSKMWYQGKPEWQEMKVTLRDDATGQVARMIGEQLQKQFDFFEQSSAASGSDYKFTTRLEVLDGGNGAYDPVILEAWELYGCFVTNADYGNMEYSAAEPMEVALSISFDNALNDPLASGVGVAVGRTTGSTVA
jgi:hypothetical protein